MIHIKLFIPNFCLLLRYLASFFKHFHIIKLGFVGCLQKFGRRKRNKVLQAFKVPQLLLHVTTDNRTILPRSAIDEISLKFIVSITGIL